MTVCVIRTHYPAERSQLVAAFWAVDFPLRTVGHVRHPRHGLHKNGFFAERLSLRGLRLRDAVVGPLGPLRWEMRQGVRS